MKTIFNITTVNLSATSTQKGWYDSEDDAVNELYFKLYVQYSSSVKFLIKPYTW